MSAISDTERQAAYERADKLCAFHDPVTDDMARRYDPATNDYDLATDPRCLWGWGPPERGCDCRSGHACFRAFGHRGKCWDAGGPLGPVADRLPCETVQRPKDWDAYGREEANR